MAWLSCLQWGDGARQAAARARGGRATHSMGETSPQPRVLPPPSGLTPTGPFQTGSFASSREDQKSMVRGCGAAPVGRVLVTCALVAAAAV